MFRSIRRDNTTPMQTYETQSNKIHCFYCRSSFVVQENSPIPSTVLQEIHDLQTDGLSFEDAVVNIRGALVPTGYTPYPFHKDIQSHS